MSTIKIKLQQKLHVLYIRHKKKLACRRTFVNWYKKFNLVDFSTKNQPHSSWPTLYDEVKWVYSYAS